MRSNMLTIKRAGVAFLPIVVICSLIIVAVAVGTILITTPGSSLHSTVRSSSSGTTCTISNPVPHSLSNIVSGIETDSTFQGYENGSSYSYFSSYFDLVTNSSGKELNETLITFGCNASDNAIIVQVGSLNNQIFSVVSRPWNILCSTPPNASVTCSQKQTTTSNSSYASSSASSTK